MTLVGLVRITVLALCWMMACATQSPAVTPALVAAAESNAGRPGSLFYPAVTATRLLLSLGNDSAPNDREGRYRLALKDADEDPPDQGEVEFAYDREGASFQPIGAGGPVSGRPTGIPPIVLAAYRNAEQRSGQVAPGCYVPWYVLAGIGRVESGHARHGSSTVITPDGRVTPPIIGSPLDGRAGNAAIRDTDGGRWDGDTIWDRAVGPMQFIPSSWHLFGQDGNDDGIKDPNNLFDATLAAATHLCRSAPGDYDHPDQLARALFAYNRSRDYVRVVMGWIATYAGTDPNEQGITTPLPSPTTAHQPPANRSGTGGSTTPSSPEPRPDPTPSASPTPTRSDPPPSPEPSPTPTRSSPPPSSKPSPTPTPKPSPTPSERPRANPIVDGDERLSEACEDVMARASELTETEDGDVQETLNTLLATVPDRQEFDDIRDEIDEACKRHVRETG